MQIAALKYTERFDDEAHIHWRMQTLEERSPEGPGIA
jgi:hypothetical protein